MKKKIKVYLYTRVSTAMQIDGYSLESQKTKMKVYVVRVSYDDVKGQVQDRCYNASVMMRTGQKRQIKFQQELQSCYLRKVLVLHQMNIYPFIRSYSQGYISMPEK